MADPKSTNKFKGSETKFDFYTDLLVHTNGYANNLFANNISSNNFIVGSQTLEEYITSFSSSGNVSNTYLTGTFSSNNYVHSTFTSNNYIDGNFVSNNYLEDIKTTFGTGDVTNTYLIATFTSNNYIDGRFTSNVYVETNFLRSNANTIKTSGVLNFADNVKATFGADDDFQILHNGVNTQLNNYAGTLQIIQRANDLDAIIYTDDGSGGITEYIRADGSTGETILYHYGSQKIATKATGVEVTGDITPTGSISISDNSKIKMGNTTDLQLYHDSTHSYIDDTGTGDLRIRGSGSVNIMQYNNSELMAKFKINDAVLLYYDGVKKFETSSAGIDVTGTVKATDFTVGTSGKLTSNNYVNDSFSSNTYLTGHFTTNNFIQSYVSSEVASLVDSAPATLDTLNELAAALGDDANFATTVSTQIGIRATNTYVNSTFSSNNYLQGQLGDKLNSSSYTASDVLTKIKTVDGTGSGLDADTLDGQEASAFQTVAAPNSPSITSTTVVNETIELVFGQSSTSGVTRYEVWSDGATGSDYSLISIIPSQDAAASMSVVDVSFDTGGTVAYRVYAIKNGVYSTAATTTKSFTIPSLDVTNMSVVSSITNYDIQYDLPETRFSDHIEIYKDAETTLVALSRTGAALIYSGSSDNFTYNVPPSDKAKFHQFWVEVVSV